MNKIAPLLFLIVFTLSCTGIKNNNLNEELITLQTELDSLKNLRTGDSDAAKGQLATFLTFQENNAEEAMNFYIGLFENSRIIDVQRHGNDGPGKDGSILYARFELNGSKFACSDSPMKHEWNFTPGVSIWVECKTDDEIDNLFAKLSDNGKVLMPLGKYSFSPKFAFVEDQFGVSWQMNLN